MNPIRKENYRQIKTMKDVPRKRMQGMLAVSPFLIGERFQGQDNVVERLSREIAHTWDMDVDSHEAS